MRAAVSRDDQGRCVAGPDGTEGACEDAVAQGTDLGQPWAAEALEQTLRLRWPALRLEIARSLPSTNSELLTRLRGELAASATRVDPWLLVAEQQTQGRGRMGRSWLSRPGRSLTFSLAFESARGDLAGLSLAVGAALADALDPPLGQAGCSLADSDHGAAASIPAHACRLLLKWPNDLVLVRGPHPESVHKLGGVLIESLGMGARRIVVVGVGLNVLPLPPLDLAAAGPATAEAAALSELHADATPRGLLWLAAPALLQAVDAFMSMGFAAFAADFARRDLLAGHQVLSSGALSVQGCAEGVDADGALLVRDPAGVLHRLSSGEISVRARQRVAPAEAVAC